MIKLTIYDPPMCCSTGICGTDVDQRLVDFAADLDWLKAQGASVRRISLSQEPVEFVANDTIRALMQASDGDDLPAFLVDGRLVAKARYPNRAELATWAGVAASAKGVAQAVPASGGCCGGNPAPVLSTSGCCGATSVKTTGNCC